MTTLGWLFVLFAIYLGRALLKGQVIDKDGNFTLLQNAELTLTAFITGDSSTLPTDTEEGGLNVATPAIVSVGDAPSSALTAKGDDSWNESTNTTPAEWNKLNPRTPAQACLWASSRHSFPSGMCERMVTLAYGHPGGFPTAKAHADAMDLHGGVPPRGALVFLKTGNPAQHVYLSLGNGQGISTDFDGKSYKRGAMSAGSVNTINKAMGGQYRGWSAPVFKR